MNRFIQTAIALGMGISLAAQPLPVFHPSMRSVQDIPLPKGYERITAKPGSFAAYLQSFPLRSNNIVYLYNGSPKPNQSLHYAVLDLSTGNKDLQQCADMVMRLRAEYFYAKKLYDSIRFPKTASMVYRYSDYKTTCTGDQRACFFQFMEKVFMNCGTYTLENSLRKVPDIEQMQIGDVLIKGGAPGHAEIVVDMAVNRQTGQKIFLLAEGYMPAQDAHIVLNPVQTTLGPWYLLNDEHQVVTATWIFSSGQLKRF
jgi:hypothetical protein